MGEACPKCLKGFKIKHFHVDGSVCPNGRLEVTAKLSISLTKKDLKKAWDDIGLDRLKFEEFCKLLGF